MNLQEREVASLREQVKNLTEERDFLTEKLAYVEGALLGTSDAWLLAGERLRMTPHQVRIIRCLLKRHNREVATKEAIHTAMYLDRPDDWPDPKVLDVQVCKMRRILPPDTIETVWGRGYRLSDAGREWLEDQLRDILQEPNGQEVPSGN
jgi:DNA-binding response OmpR family regulator